MPDDTFLTKEHVEALNQRRRELRRSIDSTPQYRGTPMPDQWHEDRKVLEALNILLPEPS
jgi:hypothetical protein